MRVRLPIVLLFALVLALGCEYPAWGQTAPEVRVKFTNQRELFIPFQTDRTRPIKQLRLYAQRNMGDWAYLTSGEPADKGFTFTTKEDGTYALTVQTEFNDGTTEPAKDQLTPQLRIVVDTVPPKFTVRAFSSGDSAGVEWDITDENLDPSTIRLEYRWQGMADWRPIDPNVQFRARDQRSWVLKPDQRIEIRVRARDSAKNEGVSSGVWTSLAVGDQRQFGVGSNTGMSSGGDPNRGETQQNRPNNTTVHYVNEKELALDFNVIVGSSGLKRVKLFRSENNQRWESMPGFTPGATHPAVMPGDKARTERLTINHTVEKEGEYGFILIAESKAGKAMPDPKPKDPPQLRVIVDMTPPKVTLLDAKVRKVGEQGVAVDVSWRAEDANMAASPITIKYAEKREGPWRVVSANLDNTGRYTWNVPPTEPHSFLLKVEAVDRASNVGEAITGDTVELDLQVPQVEIQGVSPVKNRERSLPDER